jgi:hypothetical protein
LERWGTKLEAERSALALSILNLEVGDIVIAGTDERPVRISVTGASLYVGSGVTLPSTEPDFGKMERSEKFAIPSRFISRTTRRGSEIGLRCPTPEV